MKTWMAKTEEAERNWWVVDATGQRVGRLATTVATLLRGKHKPTFTPHADAGDFVVIINTDKLELTGDKLNTKTYFRHSRFFGSLKEKTAAQMQIEDSTFIIHEAVRGMLPTNKLSRDLMKKMKLFKGAEHTHAAQKPQAYTLKTKKK
ncbi:MAG: 50S ribosomal protein L13 [Bdellovibrio sp.]|jgi:large subunit ribosomal protein L13